MKDLDALTFLDWRAIISTVDIMLTQTKYTMDLIDMAQLADSKPIDTTMEVDV